MPGAGSFLIAKHSANREQQSVRHCTPGNCPPRAYATDVYPSWRWLCWALPGLSGSGRTRGGNACHFKSLPGEPGRAREDTAAASLHPLGPPPTPTSFWLVETVSATAPTPGIHRMDPTPRRTQIRTRRISPELNFPFSLDVYHSCSMQCWEGCMCVHSR